jgi:hypothetical protein
MRLTPLERAALEHAAEWLRYSRSPQARRDLEADKARRAALTIKSGHLLTCGLLRCAPGCPRLTCRGC